MKRLFMLIMVLIMLALPLAMVACTTTVNIVETADDDGRFATLIAALEATGLDDTLEGAGPYTVFAPTDDAFNALPAGKLNILTNNPSTLTNVLMYHVMSCETMAEDVVGLTSATTLEGSDISISVEHGDVMIDDAKILETDIQCSNGVIHAIDAVLMPPLDIVDTAIYDGRFTTLITALEAADLDATLKGDGPYTVFAPTDDAFDALSAGTLDALLDDIPALTDVLLYHVVSGEVMSDVVVTLDSAVTLEGSAVNVSVSGGNVMIDDATVIIADIQCSNGVIHVIDKVLIPQ